MRLTVNFGPCGYGSGANNLREAAVTFNSSNPAKMGAWIFAVLWTAGMIWWSGPFDVVNVVFLVIGGAIAGYLWYLFMRWYIRMRTSAK
jgi:hypothetical protein